jgi:hypothetical protein
MLIIRNPRFWLLVVIVGGVTALIMCLTSSPQANPAAALQYGNVRCDAVGTPYPQANLEGSLQVDRGHVYQSATQIVCNGTTRSAGVIQVNYHLNASGTVTFTWQAVGIDHVQWLAVAPLLHEGENGAFATSAGQTSITVPVRTGDRVYGAIVYACSPELPPGSEGVTPGTCQVPGSPLSYQSSFRELFLYRYLVGAATGYPTRPTKALFTFS